VLLNLVGNAVKFTSQGEVVLLVSLERETASEADLRFSVRDSGIGIPADRLGLLFTKFTQVDSSTTRRYGGTGLGLAISKQLVEMMGGNIGVESKEGYGSEFRFTVRMAKQPTTEGKIEQVLAQRTPVVTHRSLGDPRLDNLHVLLAEDNITNQLVALGILGKLGLHAKAVANGREAIAALRDAHYDLVLMDLQMPEMDGLDATRAIRAAGDEGLNRDIPIVAMTACAMEQDRARCFEVGMDDYLAKPITPKSLAQVIEKWLPKLDRSPGKASQVSAASPPNARGPADCKSAAFDEKALLDSVLCDRSLAKAIASTFLDDVPKQLERLQGYLQEGDVHSAGRQAHTIRGAASAVGATSLANEALKLEQAGKAGDLEKARSCFGELQAQFEPLTRSMQLLK